MVNCSRIVFLHLKCVFFPPMIESGDMPLTRGLLRPKKLQNVWPRMHRRMGPEVRRNFNVFEAHHNGPTKLIQLDYV